MGMRAFYWPWLGQKWKFFNKSEFIWFLPVNNIVSVIYSTIRAKLSLKIGHILVRDFHGLMEVYREMNSVFQWKLNAYVDRN